MNSPYVIKLSWDKVLATCAMSIFAMLSGPQGSAAVNP